MKFLKIQLNRFTAWMLFLALAFTAVAQAAPPNLIVSGNQFQTSGGCSVRLRGVNVPSLEWSNTGEGPPLSSVQSAVGTYKANIIRLPVNQDRWFGCQGGTSSAYQTIVDNIVNYCSGAGAYVIIDLHWSGTSSSATSPCGGGWGTATGQQDMPDANSVTFWTDVANRYKNNPAVFFGLYNEPKSVSWSVWQTGGTTTQGFTTPGHQALINAIRGTGANNIIFIGGLDWAYDLRSIDTYPFTNPGNGFAYDVHIYGHKGNGTDNASNWDTETTIAAGNHPVFIGEFGPDPSGPSCNNDSGAFDGNLFTFANGSNNRSYIYSWTAWAWHNSACPAMLSALPSSLNSWHGQPVVNQLATVAPTCSGGSPVPTNTPTRTPTATPTTVPPNITLTKTTGGPTSNYSDAAPITMVLNVCNSAGSVTANSVTVTDSITNPLSWAFQGPGYSPWVVTVSGTPVSINPTGTTYPNLSWVVSNLPGGSCVPITFIVGSYSYSASDACQVVSDRGIAQWSGGGPVTSNTIAITVVCAPTNTPTSTATRTFTPTSTSTNTLTSTPTRTNTFTGTPTYTATRTNSPTNSPSATATSTPAVPTNTPTATVTNSPTKTNSPTATPTNTPTRTNTNTATLSFTPTLTFTLTATPSSTPTRTFTTSNTPTATPTNTPVPPTSTPTATATNTATRTNTPTSTSSNTSTRTNTPTFSMTPTSTSTSTSTASFTSSWTATFTSTPSATPTRTSTPTNSFTLTFTSTATPSSTPSATLTQTYTRTHTFTPTITPTFTLTSTGTLPPTNTPTATGTNTATSTWTSTFTSSATPTATASRTPTATASSTPTRTNSFTPTNSLTSTFTPTNTNSLTATSTPTRTASSTPTATLANSATPTSTSTSTFSFTPTHTNTPTFTSSNTATASMTPTRTFTSTSTATLTSTSTSTHTYTPTVTSTPTLSPTGTLSPSSTPTPSFTSTSTGTPTASFTSTRSATPTATSTWSRTPTPSSTPTSTNTLSPTASATGTSSPTATRTNTFSSTPSATAVNTATSTASRTPTASSTFTGTPSPTATSTRTFTATSTHSATATATFTFSASNTPSNTPTWTPTLTGTFTKTPTPTTNGEGKVVLYPNPTDGGSVQVLPPYYSGVSDVRIQIFTAAFRMVRDDHYSNQVYGVLTLELKDRTGVPLASGLYYVVVQTKVGRSVGKLLILR